MIAIVDYGVGNLRSVQKAFESLDVPVTITDDIETINNAKGIILPGVGAFKDAIDNLREKNLIACIKENVKKGKPLLGICLGMQLLYERSFEHGSWQGLGILEGEVVKFEQQEKVPHMGWNNLIVNREHLITRYIHKEPFVYFVHSYYVRPSRSLEVGQVIAWADYGGKFPAIVGKDNVIGMQFHPEKSGAVGLNLLKAFKEMIK